MSAQQSAAVGNIFDEARTRFLNSLPPNHQLNLFSCASALVLIDNVQKLNVITRNKHRGGRLLSCVKKFTDNLTPFFRVIDIVVSSHPEYAAVVWGGINLVLQTKLASNFVAFFEKLNKTLERMTKCFPGYLEIERIVKAHKLPISDNVKQSLGRVYEDLFVFLHDVIKIFSKPDGRSRSAPLVMGALAFKPFDARFSDILSSLADDQKLLELEVGILSLSLHEKQGQLIRNDLVKAQEAANQHANRIELKLHDTMIPSAQSGKDSYSSAQQALQESALCNIRNWLAVANFASNFEESFSHREADTCTWIFADQLYQEWSDVTIKGVPSRYDKVFGSCALWVHGLPGAGKTVLAASIVDDLLDQFTTDESNAEVVYHFFKQTAQCTEPAAAYRSMLAQILHRHKQDVNLVNKFSFAMLEVSTGQPSATNRELLDLLRLCLDYLGDVLIVLDGIDECVDSEMLLDDLHSLNCGESYKIIMLSRLNVSSLLRMVPESQRITMSNEGVIDDIRLYAHRKLDIMLKQKKFPPTTQLDVLTEQLVQGSGHMFLWMRLMITYLKSPALLPKQRLKTTTDVHPLEGLDIMYLRIVDLIAQAAAPELFLAVAALTWLASTKRQLSENELREAMRLEIRCDADDDFEDFRHTIVVVCGGLVEPSTFTSQVTDTDFCLQYIHLSARDFFLRLSHGGLPVPDKIRPHLQSNKQIDQRIGRACLTYIAEKLDSPLSGDPKVQADERSLYLKYPLASYAAVNWIDHLIGHDFHNEKSPVFFSKTSEISSDTIAALDLLLSRQFAVMAWIEASYICSSKLSREKSHITRVGILHRWCEAVSNIPLSLEEENLLSTIQMCLDFVKDLSILHQAMGKALMKSPRLIWSEAPAFVPSRFWASNASTRVDVLNPRNTDEESYLGQKALVTISESLLSHSLIAVLSIWPTRNFETYWNSVSDTIDLGQLYLQCANWVARYQIWSIQRHPPSSMLDSCVKLSSTEVFMAIHQSLRKEGNGNWRFHFPLTVRDDLQSFIVLQTLYIASPPAMGKDVTVESVNLNLEDSLGLKPIWWNLKKVPPSLDAKISRGGPSDLGTFYTYKLTFSPSGALIYFRDYHQFQKSTLAILSVGESGSVTIVQKCEGESTWDDDVVAFHPSAPLIFTFRDRLVYAWRFSQSPQPVVFYQPNCGYHDGLKEMEISNCGNYIVMKFPGRAPVIQRISHLFNSGSAPQSSQATNALQFSKNDNDKILFRPAQVMKGVDLDISEDGSYRSLSVRSTLGGVDVSEWTRNEKGQSTQKDVHIQQRLTALPEWESLQSSTVAVRWPSESEQTLKIVMNQASQKYYSHATAASSVNTGPVLIQRDISALDDPMGEIERSKLTHRSKKSRESPTGGPALLTSAASNSGARTNDEVEEGIGWV